MKTNHIFVFCSAWIHYLIFVEQICLRNLFSATGIWLEWGNEAFYAARYNIITSDRKKTLHRGSCECYRFGKLDTPCDQGVLHAINDHHEGVSCVGTDGSTANSRLLSSTVRSTPVVLLSTDGGRARQCNDVAAAAAVQIQTATEDASHPGQKDEWFV